VVAPSVAVVRGDGPVGTTSTVYVARLPAGPLLVLDGTAALIWGAIEAGAEITESVARQTGVEPGEIRPDVERLLAELEQFGVLSAAPSGGRQHVARR